MLAASLRDVGCPKRLSKPPTLSGWLPSPLNLAHPCLRVRESSPFECPNSRQVRRRMSCTKHRSFGCWQDTNGPIPPSRFGTIQRGVCQTQHSLVRYGFHVAHEPRISRPANRTRTHFRSRRPSVEAAHFPARAARVRLTCWLPHGWYWVQRRPENLLAPSWPQAD